jgi:hypothetical protein
VLRGPEGVGKSKVGEVLGSLLGERYYSPVSEPRYVTGRFNGHLKSCLLLHADEAFWAGDQTAEGKLKDLITGAFQYIELKNHEAIPVRNYLRLLVTGNPDWLVPVSMEGRRFAVLDVGDEHQKDANYFARIDAEMDNGGREALLYYLLNFDLTQVNLREVPLTSALRDQKLQSLSPEEGWWLDVLRRGRLSPFAKGNVCSCDGLFDNYVEHAKEQGVRRRTIEILLGKMLRKFVPGLRVIQPRDSGRRRQYIFPPLDACRDGFCEQMGQHMPWPVVDDWQ